MRLNRQTEIAISILIACGKAEGHRLQTVHLARTASATRDHAAQVISLLVRSGHLRSLRGRQGGICLAADPRSLPLGDILRITQPDLFDGKRKIGGPSAAVLAPVVEAAFAPFLRAMEQITIADLLGGPNTFHSHCFNCRLSDRLLHPLSPPPSPVAHQG
ncbi:MULTISPECIES: Rrf2 family transcriptional regulator [unclassified Sinorhizobium]|uniref:RrF2 family transcriptional regulator n=1 Tax=unclassified Sinorhizobium TaxID=2613772 RepID=UPI0035267B93